MHKHSPISSGRESRLKIEFGYETYPLHECNKLLCFNCKGFYFLVEENLTGYSVRPFTKFMFKGYWQYS